MRRLTAAALCLLLFAACSTTNAGASRNISCIGGSDCDEKWSRAMQWLEQNTSSKVTVAEGRLTTEEAADAAKPAFEVTKESDDQGQTFRISMRAWCTASECTDLAERLRVSFTDYVTSGR